MGGNFKSTNSSVLSVGISIGAISSMGNLKGIFLVVTRYFVLGGNALLFACLHVCLCIFQRMSFQPSVFIVGTHAGQSGGPATWIISDRGRRSH